MVAYKDWVDSPTVEGDTSLLKQSLVLIAGWFICQSSLSQSLRELDPISQGGTRIRSQVALPRTGSLPPRLAVFFDSGKLVIYGAKRAVAFQDQNVRAFAAIAEKHLYYETDSGFTRLDLQSYSRTRLKLPHKGYSNFVLFDDEGKDLLFAVSKSDIDLISLPQCVLLSQVKPDPDWRKHLLLYESKVVVFLNRDNELAGFDLTQQRYAWKLDAGTKSMKVLGITFNSVKNAIFAAVTCKEDHSLYAGTILGDLYRIDIKTGSVLRNMKQFRGDANNAGCLTQMYLEDMDRDGRKDIVACSVDNCIYCLNASDFSIKWIYDTGNEVQMPIRFFDTTGDGIPEIFVVNYYDLRLVILDGASGKPLLEQSLKTENTAKQCLMTVVDLDGDGNPYVFALTSPEKLRAFRYQ